MIVSNEQANVDIIYIFGATSKEELQDKIIEKLREGYTVIGENELNMGNRMEYNARMMKHIKQ